MKIFKNYFTVKILLVILIFAAILRFYKLGSYPVSLSWDEVAIGYNAYSISQTQKDEYGTKWPILFKSFNDFKLPGYVYIDSFFVKLFGLSAFVVRLPSVLFGTIAVLTIYFFTKKLFNNQVALLSAFFLAISPWHLQVSRPAFEASIALSVVLIGMTCFLYGLKNKFLALASILILASSIYFYYSPRIFVPIMLGISAMIFRKEITKNFKYYSYGLILSILLLIPITTQVLRAEGFKRVKEVSIFQDQSLIVDYVSAKAKKDDILAKVFLNRRIPVTIEAFHNYFSHFSFGFLFFGDDPNPRHRVPFHGNFYIFEIPLMLFGFWFLLRQNNLKVKYFLLTWILLAPLSAAFAKETPHGLRSLLMLPPLIILSSIGTVNLAKKYFSKIILTGTVIFFFIIYLYSYYVIYPLRDNLSWAFGYKEMFSQVSKIENKYDRIIVSGHYWKPYIFYLFYNKIDPYFYQNASTGESIGKFRFGTTYWDSGGKDSGEEDIERSKGTKTLVVISPNEFDKLKHKDKFVKLFQINDYSGKNNVFIIGEWQ